MTKGDGIDNDCDGRVNEEKCGDGIDNDGDGLHDEDCETPSPEAVGSQYVLMFMENRVTDNSGASSAIEVVHCMCVFNRLFWH